MSDEKLFCRVRELMVSTLGFKEHPTDYEVYVVMLLLNPAKGNIDKG